MFAGLPMLGTDNEAITVELCILIQLSSEGCVGGASGSDLHVTRVCRFYLQGGTKTLLL